jgi:membrane-bound lytic murein transglycosylase D
MRKGLTYLLALGLSLVLFIVAAQAELITEPASTAKPQFSFEKSSPRRAVPFPIMLNAAVRAYVDAYLANSAGLRRCYQRSAPYFSQMVKVLNQRGLPPDIVYLAFAESAFSSRGAGPWQLTKRTARRFGLRINRYLDERRDPIKSTRAAAEYLAELHDEVGGDWRLTIVAWNQGEGGIDRFVGWDNVNPDLMLKDLPSRTRSLIDRFMAVDFISHNAQAYGLQQADFAQVADDYGKLHVGPGLLSKVATRLHLSTRQLRQLNPALLTDRIPRGGYDLTVPASRLAGLDN